MPPSWPTATASRSTGRARLRRLLPDRGRPGGGRSGRAADAAQLAGRALVELAASAGRRDTRPARRRSPGRSAGPPAGHARIGPWTADYIALRGPRRPRRPAGHGSGDQARAGAAGASRDRSAGHRGAPTPPCICGSDRAPSTRLVTARSGSGVHGEFLAATSVRVLGVQGPRHAGRPRPAAGSRSPGRRRCRRPRTRSASTRRPAGTRRRPARAGPRPVTISRTWNSGSQSTSTECAGSSSAPCRRSAYARESSSATPTKTENVRPETRSALWTAQVIRSRSLAGERLTIGHPRHPSGRLLRRTGLERPRRAVGRGLDVDRDPAVPPTQSVSTGGRPVPRLAWIVVADLGDRRTPR